PSSAGGCSRREIPSPGRLGPSSEPGGGRPGPRAGATAKGAIQLYQPSGSRACALAAQDVEPVSGATLVPPEKRAPRKLTVATPAAARTGACIVPGSSPGKRPVTYMDRNCWADDCSYDRPISPLAPISMAG